MSKRECLCLLRDSAERERESEVEFIAHTTHSRFAVFLQTTTITERTIIAADAVIPAGGTLVLAPTASGDGITTSPFLVVTGRFVINGTLLVDLRKFSVKIALYERL